MSDARDFLMSSDHQIDKIVYFKEMFVPVSNKQDSLNIDTGLPFCPLVFGVWSTTPDFTVCHPFTQGGIMSSRTNDFVTDFVGVKASRTNGTTKITIDHYFTSVHNYYVRIYGFMPTDIELSADITSTSAQELISSSDYNYRKLALAGVEPYTIDTTSQTGQASTITINHNLGYLPQTMAWLETSYIDEREIIPFGFGQLGSDRAPYGHTILTTTSVMITPLPGQWGDNFRVHYRIYYDEA